MKSNNDILSDSSKNNDIAETRNAKRLIMENNEEMKKKEAISISRGLNGIRYSRKFISIYF